MILHYLRMDTSSTQSIPQILSRSDVSLLSQGLDAGDILECYALVRRAPLHNALLPDAPITVHKVALGLRYRTLKVTDEAKVRELTLEYGPQRMGASLTQDSMPSVQREQQIEGVDEFPSSNSNETGTGGNKFLTWENEGKVYYTTQIASTGYVSAYYMASVTGAVLGKILEKAVEYPMEHAYVRGRPRRYQPFVVVDGSTDIMPPPGYEGEISDHTNRKVMLKSSSSSDFMYYMWDTLAELGVTLDPILAPPTYQVQLLATSVEKIKVGPPTWVTHSAATFYDKLYKCIEAKVTGDYSQYAKPTPAPTAIEAPSQSPSTFDSAINSTNTTEEVLGNDEPGGGAKRILRADFPGTPEAKETDPPIDAVRDIENQILSENSTVVNATVSDAISIHNETNALENTTWSIDVHASATISPNQSAATVGGTGSPDEILKSIPPSIANATIDDTSNVSSAPTLPPAPSIPPSWAPSVSSAPSAFKISPQDTKSEVDNAQEAANQAKQAAAEAKDAAKTEVDSKAANAAEIAANAAQKAADATNTAAAQSAMDAFLSGDGTSIVPILSPCFSDPQFGISTLDENGTLVTHAYLYVDGSSYYKLDLTFPFMQIVQVEHTLPQPPDFSGPGEGGDFVDWTLALLLLFLTLFGILMLFQQAFGGYVKSLRPWFKFQKWFFNPLHYEDTVMEEEQRLSQTQQGGGQAYSFGEDVIPVSMGGRRATGTSFPVSQLFRRKQKDDENYERERIPLNGSGEHQEASENDACGIELTEGKSPLSRRAVVAYSRGSSRGSADSGDSGSENSEDSANGIVGNIEFIENDHRIREEELPSSFTRHPDLVEMPNLKSSSKVAIPAGVKRNTSFYSTGGNTL